MIHVLTLTQCSKNYKLLFSGQVLPVLALVWPMSGRYNACEAQQFTDLLLKQIVFFFFFGTANPLKDLQFLKPIVFIFSPELQIFDMKDLLFRRKNKKLYA